MTAGALAVLAEIILSGTTITLQPSTAPGAVAEVVIENINMNGPGDDGSYALDLGALSVGVAFKWDAVGTSDRITVTPPDGLICIPADCAATTPEGGIGRVVILEWVGF